MPRKNITTLGLDADDTLWHNERFFRLTQERLAELLADYADPAHLEQRLLETERRNIHHYGFGIKGFTLSMIETAVDVTEGKVPSTVIADILEAGRDMLSHPIEPLPGVEDTLAKLHEQYRLIVITKGDLFDQERKLAQSGLDHFFHAVEIVSNKTPDTYGSIFSRHGDGAEHALMAGNSLKSDVIPALSAGAFGVHIPFELTFALEHADEPTNARRYHRLQSIAELPDLLETLQSGDTKP
jgi:putative hydrolase of the HAD superfamily